MRASSADVPGLGFDLWAAENRALNLYRKKGTRPEGYRERLGPKYRVINTESYNYAKHRYALQRANSVNLEEKW